MKEQAGPILIVTLGGDSGMSARLAAAIQSTLGFPCSLRNASFDAAAAFDEDRGQYHSTLLLERLAAEYPDARRVIGVTPFDLFVPVLTFVFGEAQVGGRSAVVSSYRLREESYGLPADDELTAERLLKEAVHELGHTFGLRHCDDWTCVMHSTHTVERVDLKTAIFCERCRNRVAVLERLERQGRRPLE